ncbi:general secretion pathway protein D [Synechococcus sp. CS-602]|uniref:type II secretion system protein GspD n=1 Tax=unclassified Synechococcus TaxID=2626047 RepID=UPI0008FF5AD4|nr:MULTISPECIES: general secretion pathway protein D [unclassified Synechococcus]APD47918.1 general secretion pathway protein D [Synechococcus sp. SynAce01]MCT0204958.1 general secretion pathway protein D [Synechococcus sp. CS-602]MCT0244786.1 general secretion pathway protein D [Synechococcus sp. CS-601]TWB91483.1 type IV pilus assembly protein PilQ [Synechococcus sp. Ace-Pa]
MFLPVIQNHPAGLALAATVGLVGLVIPVQAVASVGPLELKVRRLPDAVEVVIEGTGPGPQLQQFNNSLGWEGQLILPNPTSLRRGPQRLALPEAGFETISLEGEGDRFVIQVTPVKAGAAPRPVVSADGRNLILSFAAAPQASLQTGRLDLNTPGRVPQSAFVPPLQPRAVAPPVGDMAVGSLLLRNPSFVNVQGPSVTMTLRNAPARDALMAVAQLGGYGFVYVDDTASNPGSGSPGSPNPITAQRVVSIAFRNEGYAKAVNSVLLAAGLQGKLEGNLILAGPNVLGKTFGSQLSKIYRLNQVSANSAADYLASLGATINKTFTTTSTSSEVASTGTPSNNTAASTASTATTTQINSFGAGQGPLLGLIGTTDSRLGTITLVGDPSLVLIAETYLKQLDLRQRQVALAVRLLDVNLENDTTISNSFAFRYGNNFIVNDNGQLLGAFGRFLPPTVGSFLGAPTENPGLQVPRDNFFDFVQAQIVSRNTTLLASPTLILQENPSILRDPSSGGGGGSGGGTSQNSSAGLDAYTIDSPIGRGRANEAAVRVGTNVITSVRITETQNGGTQCELELSTAGLILGARVEKIDDNGFVTFSLSPSISAVTDTVPGPPACTPQISILSVRRLDTGALRVREGQTLILTGVISDFDVAEVSKWPILGDLPLVGQFFRASNNQRQKRELVIMVTPRIIRDDEGGTFGYGIRPTSEDARLFMSNPQ